MHLTALRAEEVPFFLTNFAVGPRRRVFPDVVSGRQNRMVHILFYYKRAGGPSAGTEGSDREGAWRGSSDEGLRH